VPGRMGAGTFNRAHQLTCSGEARTLMDVRSQGKGNLYPSEELVIEVEVDESFAGTRSTG
jgi:hypothetical protein